MIKRIAKKMVEDQKKIGNDEKIDGIEKSDESKNSSSKNPQMAQVLKMRPESSYSEHGL